MDLARFGVHGWTTRQDEGLHGDRHLDHDLRGIRACHRLPGLLVVINQGRPDGNKLWADPEHLSMWNLEDLID